MRALHLENGKIEYLTDYPKPERKAGYSLVSVIAAGICSTDSAN